MPNHSDVSQPFADEEYAAVRKAIRTRRTWKVLADSETVARDKPSHHDTLDDGVLEAIRESGWAPFHYDRKSQGIPEPWRFYLLRQDTCRQIASQIPDWFDDIKPNNKIPAMLNACGSLVLATWIPQFDGGKNNADVIDEKLRQVNEEHLAATSAAIQNLLLLLTARNLGSYWSSGGLFRSPNMLERLGIDLSERLLGAIFVDYSPDLNDRERIPGKLREMRSDAKKWVREISLEV